MLSRCLQYAGKGRGCQQARGQDEAHQQGVIQHQCQQPAEGACRAGSACVSGGARLGARCREPMQDIFRLHCKDYVC